MKASTLTTIAAGLVLGAAFLPASRAASPFDEYSRRGKLDVYSFGQYQSGDTARSSSLGVTLKLDSSYGGGIGVGYHFTDNLAVNTDLSIGSAGLTGTAAGTTIRTDLTQIGANLGLEYNILKRRLTPLLTAGGGFVNLSDVGGIGASETDFSYFVGGGVRWDINDHWFMKAVYKANFTELRNTDSSLLLHTLTLGIGYSF